MGYLRKKLERRTFSQDRYNILIKRQKAGKATFNELTELDEIVNRVPDIREQVIIENFMPEITEDSNEQRNNDHNPPAMNPGIWTRIRSFVNRIFASWMLIEKSGRSVAMILA